MASSPAWQFAHHFAWCSPGWPPRWESGGAPGGPWVQAAPSRRRQTSPARGGRSRSPRGPPSWEARIPLPSETAGRTRSGRPRSLPQARRRGTSTLRGIFLLALSTEGLHVLASADVDSPAGPTEAPRRQRFILALTLDELSVIAALRYAAGDFEGSWDVSSARGISMSSDDES